jgi:hypothetical protein
MKKLIVLISATIFLTAACNKNEPHLYSCDDDVNSYVVDNLDNVNNLKRKDLLRHDLETQRALFRAMSPQNRYICWKEKIEKTLSLEWTDNELNHINLLNDAMNVEWFRDKNLNNPDFKYNLNDFLLDWIVTGINDYRWSKGLVFSIVATLDIKSDANKLIGYELIENSMNRSDGSCNCSASSDWCDISGQGTHQYCKRGHDGCIPRSAGCGTLWTSSCDGKCVLGFNWEE